MKKREERGSGTVCKPNSDGNSSIVRVILDYESPKTPLTFLLIIHVNSKTVLWLFGNVKFTLLSDLSDAILLK